jgi:hypothetical protein
MREGKRGSGEYAPRFTRCTRRCRYRPGRSLPLARRSAAPAVTRQRPGLHREAARARMRVLVKRLLRKYGYPPDLQDAAVQKVLQQAEASSADWAA